MAGKLTCVNIETTQASSAFAPAITGPDTGWLTADADGGNVVGFKYKKLPTGEVMVQLYGSASGKVPVGYRCATGAGYFATCACGADANSDPQWFKVNSDGTVSSSVFSNPGALGLGYGTYFPEA